MTLHTLAARRGLSRDRADIARLSHELAQRDEQLAIALGENATLVGATRHLADQVAALKRWRLRALFCCPWLAWLR